MVILYHHQLPIIVQFIITRDFTIAHELIKFA